MGLFDIHAHLTHPRLLPRVDEVLDNARSAGLTSIVTNGLNPEDNQRVAELATAHPGLVRPAYGLYPVDAVLPEMHAGGVDYPRQPGPWSGEDAVEDVRTRASEAIAIGEIGLDGYWVPTEYWGRQETIFRALVQVALDHDKPIIIHTRKRERRAFEILGEMGAKRVAWHCYGGKLKLARQIAAELGHCFSIPANARRSQSFTRMLETLPRDQLLLETDCPYLPPVRETTNEPATVHGTCAYAAELWSETMDGARARFEETYRALFREDP
jgi:TatD DNase family protein